MMQRAAAFAGESGWAPAFPPSRGAGRATDSTRRPRGLVIEDEGRVRDVGSPTITKDGVTVAKEVELKSPRSSRTASMPNRTRTWT